MHVKRVPLLDPAIEWLNAKFAALTPRSAQVNFQNLIDAMPDPVLVIGQDFRIRSANAEYGRLVGRPMSEVVGNTCYAVGCGRDQPCAPTLIACPVVEIRANARSMRSVMTLRHSQGTELPVQIEAAPLVVDGELQIVEVLIPLERSIRFSQEQRLSTIGLLANGIAHEVHNPLASIRLALQASLRGLKEQNMGREELMEYLQLVDHEIDRCVLITHRLLQMSAPPQETLTPVHFASALDDVLSLLRHECETRNIQIVKNLLMPELSVMADEAELRQVFINVIHNALHAMAGGGQVTVTGQLTGNGLYYQMDFADTGVGIALEDQARIFLPFFSRRVDGVRGTGLGLAICKGVMERFGGKITVDSELHQGSAFHLLLCVAPMAMATD